MNRNHLHHTFIALVMLVAIVACVLPGQAAQPVPTTNPNLIETAIVGTALAAAKQTEQANSVTATGISPDTATPAPKISSVGTSLVYLADGSTQFTDHVAGMQMSFPTGWLVVRVGEQEYYAAWGRQETQNPKFLDIFASIQNLDPKVFKMTALDTRPDHIIYNDITTVDVVFHQGDRRTLKQLKADEIKNHPPLKKYKLLSAQFFETSQGLESLNMEIQWKTGNGASQTGMGYRRRVIFKVPAGSMAVDLNILFDKKELTMPDFDQLINSITLFTP